MAFDLIIRNGSIVDGSGLAGYRADVGIVGDRIAAIGRLKERGKQEIDAEGLVVTPGFIDGHTHLDAQIFWDPIGANSCWHGVTTVVMGNCGFTLAPSAEKDAMLVVRSLERAEDISGKAFVVTFDDLDKHPKCIDVLAAHVRKPHPGGVLVVVSKAWNSDNTEKERELRKHCLFFQQNLAVPPKQK